MAITLLLTYLYHWQGSLINWHLFGITQQRRQNQAPKNWTFKNAQFTEKAVN